MWLWWYSSLSNHAMCPQLIFELLLPYTCSVEGFIRKGMLSDCCTLLHYSRRVFFVMVSTVVCKLTRQQVFHGGWWRLPGTLCWVAMQPCSFSGYSEKEGVKRAKIGRKSWLWMGVCSLVISVCTWDAKMGEIGVNHKSAGILCVCVCVRRRRGIFLYNTTRLHIRGFTPWV